MHLFLQIDGYNPCSAGSRVKHYLAFLLHAAGVPVSVNSRCHFKPGLEVLGQPRQDMIVVYTNGVAGNCYRAQKLCWYFLLEPKRFFNNVAAHVPDCQAALVYHRDYFSASKACCRRKLAEEDIITIPALESQWCFPEPKTIEAAAYKGKGVPFSVPGVELTFVSNPSGCLFTAHHHTLSILRAAKKFYTSDPHTLMADEAALCGCEVFIVKSGGVIEHQNLTNHAAGQIMRPQQDVDLARRFAERIRLVFPK